MAIEVKGGKNVSIRALRSLKGVLDNDTALMAGLIIMEPLGAVKERNFRQFMAQSGGSDCGKIPYPKMQMLSIEEILDGKRFDTPRPAGHTEDLQSTLPGSKL